MKRIVTASIVAIIVASFATVAAADRGRGKGRHGRGDRSMKAIGQLDLTPEQRAAVDSIREESRLEAEPLREQLRDLKEQIRAEWNAEAPDEQAIIALHRQVHALKGQLAEMKIQARVDTMAVLTPEQRAQLAEMKAERKAQRAEHKANRKGKRGGKKGRGKGYGRGNGQGYGQGMSVDPALDTTPRF